MTEFPTLQTCRLILNRPTKDDLKDVVLQMNSTPEISQNTLTLPYPYQEENALFWLNMIKEGFENQDAYIFGIREKENSKLIGAIGLHLSKEHHKAELGYWLGKDFWNKGYISEAVSEAIRFGFKGLHLNKIYASHFSHNPASGRVLEKCGMKREAFLRQEIFKNGKYLDITKYSVLREDFNN